MRRCAGGGRPEAPQLGDGQRKITIDSSTMVNKGLEVIEAKWLFGVDVDQIQVVVQPQSVVHSMVEYEDGAVIAAAGDAGHEASHPVRPLLSPSGGICRESRLDFWSIGTAGLLRGRIRITFQALEAGVQGREGRRQPSHCV